MSIRSFRVSLQGLLLLTVLPALSVLIVTHATRSYYDLLDLIIRGFDQKLIAISSTTASFIDPTDHAKLMEPLPVDGLAHDPNDASLWGIDIRDGQLLKIRPTDGHAIPSTLKLPKGITHLAAGLEKDTLLGVDGATGELFSFSVLTGTAKPVLRLEPPLNGIATDLARGFLYTAGRRLDRVDLRTGQVSQLGPWKVPSRGISFDPTRQVLWTLNVPGNALLELDLKDGAVRKTIALVEEKPAQAPDGWQPEPVKLISCAHDPTTNRMFGTARSLVAINLETGAVSNKGFLTVFGREIGPEYLHYAIPMRHISNRTNITFLYTQVVQERDQITYGLDGTVGEKHSPLLSRDILPADNVPDVQRLFAEGTPQVTEMRTWDKWGLLKSAFTPILNPLGQPVAMAGADVDVSAVRYQTRRALVITFSVGAVLLLFGGLLSLAIARELNRPLNRIKTAALDVAAGNYKQTPDVTRPQELGELARAFTAATSRLSHNFRELSDAMAKGRGALARDSLIQRLTTVPELRAAVPGGSPWAWGIVGGALNSVAPGGAVVDGANALVWCHRPATEALAAAARGVELSVTAGALLARHRADPVALAPALAGLFSNEVDLWALLTPAGMHVLACRGGLVHRVPVGGTPVPVADLDFSIPLLPAAGEILLLASVGTPVTSLAAPADATDAAAVLEAWRRTIPPTAPAAFAIILVSAA